MHEPLARRLAAGDETFAVTGASGWFGRVTLDLLGEALGADAFARRVRAYASRPRRLEVAGVGVVEARPLAELAGADVLAHFAFLTRDRVAELGAARFCAENLAITERVLATLRGSLLSTSSGAARQPDLDANPYGALKRLDELVLRERCPGACVVARVFNVSGPHMTKPELYALGDLIGRAQRGEPLRIGARGDVVRSYVAVADVVQVALGELLEGRSAFFETAGEREVEVEELAGVVREALGRADLPIERERDPGAPASVYVGDGAELARLAERQRLRLQPLDEQVRATADWLAGR